MRSEEPEKKKQKRSAKKTIRSQIDGRVLTREQIIYGRFVRARREELNAVAKARNEYSQAQVARRLGVSPKFLCFVESGERLMPWEKKLQLAKLLNCRYICECCGAPIKGAEQ